MLRSRARSLAKSLGIYRLVRPLTQRLINPAALRRERADRNFYRQFIKPGDLVFDVGANFGEKSRLFLQLGARVVAVEPQSDCVREIHRRCGRPRGLTIVPVAVGATAGTAQFYVRNCRAGSGLRQEWGGTIVQTIDVQVTTLDEMIAKSGCPAYLKIDVEGFELDVLQGLSHRVPVISLEYHRNPENLRLTRECIELLAARSEIELNVTPAEEMVFAWDTWQPAEKFLSEFPESIKGLPGYHYGDIFVRSLKPESP